MNTEELIAVLARDSVPPRRFGSIVGIALAGGILLAALVFFATVGFRADIDTALQSARFLFKFVFTIALGAGAARLVLALGRPGASFRQHARSLILAPLLLAAAVAVELWLLPKGQWMPRMIGHNARFCLTLIPLFSVGPLACLLAALKQGAPSRPGLAGAMAGLAASGIAATFYAANCNDDSPLFLLLWYSLAITLVTAAGYLSGRRLLRW